MKAISIRQPWVWLILHGGKDIENRDWPTRYRGPILLHASGTMTRDDFASAMETAHAAGGIEIPGWDQYRRGGLVGVAEITDCVRESKSPWFFGEYGLVLKSVKELPFMPMKGRLGIFDIPDTLTNGFGVSIRDICAAA